VTTPELTDKPTAPKHVQIAFGIWLVTALFEFLNIAVVWSNEGDLRGQVHAQLAVLVPDSEFDKYLRLAMWLATAVFAALGLLTVFLATKFRAGRNWARIWLTVLAVIGIFSILSNRTPQSMLIVILPVVGLGLMFSPESKEYLDAAKRVKRAAKHAS
jgi:hypothetical protein